MPVPQSGMTESKEKGGRELKLLEGNDRKQKTAGSGFNGLTDNCRIRPRADFYTEVDRFSSG
jgi:hypothetical protein